MVTSVCLGDASTNILLCETPLFLSFGENVTFVAVDMDGEVLAAGPRVWDDTNIWDDLDIWEDV
jgi:hypothetical protein